MDGDLSTRKLNTPVSLSLEGTIPARWLVIPGPHKSSPFDNDDPHPGVAMLNPGPNTEDLRFGKLLEIRLGESSCGSHFFATPASNSLPSEQLCGRVFCWQERGH